MPPPEDSSGAEPEHFAEEEPGHVQPPEQPGPVPADHAEEHHAGLSDADAPMWPAETAAPEGSSEFEASAEPGWRAEPEAPGGPGELEASAEPEWPESPEQREGVENPPEHYLPGATEPPLAESPPPETADASFDAEPQSEGTGRYGSSDMARYGEPVESLSGAHEHSEAGTFDPPPAHDPGIVPADAFPATPSAPEEIHAEEPAGPDSEGHAIPDLPPPRPRPERISRPSLSPPKRGGRGGQGVDKGPDGDGGRPRRGRTPAARIAAVVALVAVLVAVALVARSLKGSSTPKAPPGPVVVKVLIPEGETRLQIAQIASAAGLTGDYRAAAHSSPLLDPVKYGAPKSTPDLEGFLFPATYDMDKGAPAGRLVEEQLTAFQENFGAEDVSRARDLHITPYQMLTVASMVEREALIPSDRAKIAAVIYNRLKAGMPLGIDATIYYAVESKENVPTYTHELTESQLHIDSPYNTRTHTGLPPTPISNPGAASIHAAAYPAHVSYLYYVAGADGCGEQVFSDTQAEFEANVTAYEEAKKRNGGHPPRCKHH